MDKALDGKMVQDIGSKILGTVIKSQKNVVILDRYIYENTDSNDEYVVLLYETIGEIIKRGSSKKVLTEIIHDIQLRKFRWEHPMFDHIRKELEEEGHIDDDFEIEDGVLECFRCESKKTISYQRQTRSADEGSTTFARCVECGHHWKHNN